jgi:methyl-accepting chemotaxis protein
MTTCLSLRKDVDKLVSGGWIDGSAHVSAAPLADEAGRVLGTVVYCVPSGSARLADGSHQDFMRSLDAITAGAGELTTHLQQIAKESGHLGDLVAEATQKANATANLIAQVDTIVEMTHILSINASVEAAHAGPEGRSFAVVAHEVRRMAESTGKATMETRKMLESIQRTVAELAQSTNVNSASILAEIDSLKGVLAAITAIQQAAKQFH